jgi:hypothetical protein
MPGPPSRMLPTSLPASPDRSSGSWRAGGESGCRGCGDELGPDPEAVSGPYAVTDETGRKLRWWLDYDLRPSGSRVLRLRRLPPEFELERVDTRDGET